jgi:hypothetical protein
MFHPTMLLTNMSLILIFNKYFCPHAKQKYRKGPKAPLTHIPIQSLIENVSQRQPIHGLADRKRFAVSLFFTFY